MGRTSQLVVAGESGHLATVTPADVQRAAAAISGSVTHTPLAPSQTLSEIAGVPVSVKFENLQYTASFKERGALNKLLSLDAEQRRRGVVAASAGNHALGLAYHASRLGIPATIVMPRTTPRLKTARTSALGVDVVLEGATFEEAVAHARLLEEQDSLVQVPPFDDRLVVAGQGTVALEMLADDPTLDTLVVPVGGGGLLAGMAVAARALNPSIRLVGVRSELYPLADGATPPGHGPSIAEGIAVKAPGALPSRILAEMVDEIVYVSEAAIEQAVCLYLEIEKVVAEGAAAAPLAAVLEHRRLFAGRRAGLVLTGGNIDLRVLAGVIMRGLVESGRLARLSVAVVDTPGSLSSIAATIASLGGNVVDVQHRRHFSRLPSRQAELDFEVETSSVEEMRAIVAELQRSGRQVRTEPER